MNKATIIVSLFATLFFASCKKDAFNFSSTSQPDVPVTVANLYGMFNGVPTVSTSLASGGVITITLTIPASTGRSIKEITRVATNTSDRNYTAVQNSTGLYLSTPVAGSGNSVTFTSSTTEYTAKTGSAVTTSGTATSFLARYFYFLITLDNGQQVIPTAVRVYVNT
jgi:hypothetical protein